MCLPAAALAVIPAITSAVGAIAQFSQQSAAAKANQKAVVASTTAGYEQSNLQREQQRVQASQQEFNTTIDATKARGAVAASAGEAGVSGISVDSLLADAYGRQGRFNEAIDTNYANTSQQIQLQEKGLQAQGENRMLAVPAPSFADLAIKLGSSVASGYSAYDKASKGGA